MIDSKSDLREYMERDRIALGKKKHPKIIGDYIWKFEILMRYCEYYSNTKSKSVVKWLFLFMYKRVSLKLGFSIPINVFGPGLSIAHYGTIVVNPTARIGKNCRIHEGVTIGATNGDTRSAQIGDNVFIGSGAKVIGNISIAPDVAIAANAVVVTNIQEAGTTWGGIPAKKISNKDSHDNLNPKVFDC